MSAEILADAVTGLFHGVCLHFKAIFGRIALYFNLLVSVCIAIGNACSPICPSIHQSVTIFGSNFCFTQNLSSGCLYKRGVNVNVTSDKLSCIYEFDLDLDLMMFFKVRWIFYPLGSEVGDNWSYHMNIYHRIFFTVVESNKTRAATTHSHCSCVAITTQPPTQIKKRNKFMKVYPFLKVLTFFFMERFFSSYCVVDFHDKFHT